MTPAIVLLCVSFGTLQVVAGTEYYDSSNYKIINDASKCTDLGDNWDRAIVTSSNELYFMERSFDHSCEVYQIGGSTNDTNSGWDIPLSKYIPDDSGLVKVRVWLGCNNIYLMRDDHLFARSNQILCEKNKQTSMVNSKLEFASPESYYKILLNNSAKNNYTYWSSRCNDLGDGWNPAVFESQEELNFVREGQKRNRELSRYWIGGSTNASKNSNIGYSDYHSTGSGTYNVMINPGKHRTKINFRLKAKVASRRAPGILCEKEIVKPVYTGLELASTTSMYRKLVVNDDYGMPYETAVIYCSKIGNGWEPVVLDTEEEHDVIKEGQRSFYSSAPYWIGGSANAAINAFLNYSDYIGNNSGQTTVAVRTYYEIPSRIIGYGPVAILYDKNTFNLQVQSHKSIFPAVLCEHVIDTTGLEFASAESYYKKIVGSANNYSHYASKCEELGSGWKPAVLETKAEHDFTRASQKGLSDAGNYFIAGSALPVQTGSFQYHVSAGNVNNPVNDPQYSTSQSVNPVYVSTYDNTLMKNINSQFGLVSELPNVTTTGILCEKARA